MFSSLLLAGAASGQDPRDLPPTTRRAPSVPRRSSAAVPGGFRITFVDRGPSRVGCVAGRKSRWTLSYPRRAPMGWTAQHERHCSEKRAVHVGRATQTYLLC